jgi:diguanylate cyclase (GGDEF)-like protein
MPKRRKDTRKGADTLRVPSLESYREGAERVGSLLVVQGAEIDLGRHVLVDRPTTIGREDDNGLALNDGSISRRHCRIERDAESSLYVVVDLGSTNGTIVNGNKIEERYPLREGDKIFLGSSVVRFSYSDWVDLEYQSRVAELVTTDALTGMASRRQYELTFASMAERAEAEKTLLTLMVMDLDGLKEINDTHGHHMGGFVIAQLAVKIREILDEHGVVCRYGGDEFVGCFPGLGHAKACQLAEEVRRVIQATTLEKDGVEVSTTVSVGLATYPGNCERPSELFTIADRALYRAKRSGRNRVATPDQNDTSSGHPTLP